MAPPRLCEACERNDAALSEATYDESAPFYLCAECHHRLLKFSLRPLEWYNLAKRHGMHQFRLHDDFYDEDGTAHQPEEEVELASEYPAPTLEEVVDQPQALLEYSITRWSLTPELEAVWQRLPRATILQQLSKRFASTRDISIRARLLTICAASLGDDGADFTRFAWGEYPDSVSLDSLSQASAACLPFREGFDRVRSALAQLQGRVKREQMSALGYFHSEESLQWIEDNFFEPAADAWACLAAASRMSWDRISSWLDRGRPLSLVAIDTLLTIAFPRSPVLKRRIRDLVARPPVAEFKTRLTEYAARDPAPRVQQRVQVLIDNPSALTSRAEFNR